VLAGCAARETTLVSPADLPGSTVVELGSSTFMRIESTAGKAGVVSHQVPLPADAVWFAMDDAFQSVGLRGAGVIDEGRRIFGSPDGVIPRRLARRRLSEFLDCGSNPAGPLADAYRVTGSVVAAVRPKGESESVVEVAVAAVARPRDVAGNPVSCNSTGRLERLLSHSAMMHAAGEM
jgi:hypothetical protein